jgi:hypothetical protein
MRAVPQDRYVPAGAGRRPRRARRSALTRQPSARSSRPERVLISPWGRPLLGIVVISLGALLLWPIFERWSR